MCAKICQIVYEVLISAVIKYQTNDEGGDGDDDRSDDVYSEEWVHTQRGASIRLFNVITARTCGI